MPYSKEIKHKQKGTISLKCLNCNEQYFRTPSGAKNSKYCSMLCKSKNNGKFENHPKWNGGKIQTNCKQCNCNVFVYKSRIEKSKFTFCSARCRMLFYKPNQKNKKTDIEQIVENILIKNNIDFEVQVAIQGICRPDFLITKKNIAIFCDGDYWHNFPIGKPRDLWQINELAKVGILGIRFWGSEIMKEDFEEKLLKTLA